MAEPQHRPAEAGACGSAVPGEGDPGTGPLCPFALKMRKPVHAQEELRLRARSSAVLAGTAYKAQVLCQALPHTEILGAPAAARGRPVLPSPSQG